MNGLSLCAGIGGLDLGVEIAFPNYRCIAAVENNPEAARRFKLRFPQAKVFRDVVGFDGRPLHGLVDCVVAGWPCQPHSVAGKRLGTADERWIWSDIARILDECGAPLFFGENVSGLLRDADSSDESDGAELDEQSDDVAGGMGTVLRDLAALGFAAEWGSLRAAQVGASHGRPRVFILAYRNAKGRSVEWVRSLLNGQWAAFRDDANGAEHVADAGYDGRHQRGCGADEGRPGKQGYPARGVAASCGLPLFAPGPSDPRWLDILAARPDLAPSVSPVTAALAIALQQGTLDLQAEIEPQLCGLVDGVARWLVERRPRLQCGGNGVVPLQDAAVFTVLAERLGLTLTL